jgi:hypothetical protein
MDFRQPHSLGGSIGLQNGFDAVLGLLEGVELSQRIGRIDT